LAEIGDLGQPAGRFVGTSPLLVDVADITRLPQGVTAESHHGQRTDERSLG
jgi:hypothetical protein